MNKCSIKGLASKIKLIAPCSASCKIKNIWVRTGHQEGQAGRKGLARRLPSAPTAERQGWQWAPGEGRLLASRSGVVWTPGPAPVPSPCRSKHSLPPPLKLRERGSLCQRRATLAPAATSQTLPSGGPPSPARGLWHEKGGVANQQPLREGPSGTAHTLNSLGYGRSEAPGENLTVGALERGLRDMGRSSREALRETGSLQVELG